MYEAVPARPGRRRSTLLIALLVLVIIIVSGIATYFYVRYRSVAHTKSAAQQTASLTAQLAKTVALPPENPNVATVLDRTKLGDVQLAAQAQNGDTLIIYPEARRVILYRPSTRKVIDMFHLEATKAKEKQ